jgi:predicted transcriptional regulator
MRTTIELKDEHRAKLLELAARRGEKGFSDLVSEAIESFLANLERRETARRDALKLRGSLSDTEADEMRAVAKTLREHWR